MPVVSSTPRCSSFLGTSGPGGTLPPWDPGTYDPVSLSHEETSEQSRETVENHTPWIILKTFFLGIKLKTFCVWLKLSTFSLCLSICLLKRSFPLKNILEFL